MNPDFILMQDRKQSVTSAMAQRSRDHIVRFDGLTKIVAESTDDAVVAEAKKTLRVDYNDTRPTELTAGEYCKKNAEHGLLGVHKTGIVLMCGNARCNYQQPVSAGGVQ